MAEAPFSLFAAAPSRAARLAAARPPRDGEDFAGLFSGSG